MTLDLYYMNNYLLLSPTDVEEGKREGVLVTLQLLQVTIYFVFQMAREYHIQYHFHLLPRNF